MSGLGKVTLTNKDLRENFRVAALMIAQANGVKVEQIDLNQLVQGYVLSMIDAQPAQSVLQFPITNTDLGSLVGAPLVPLMRVVNQVDSFCAGKLGYYLMNIQFTGGKQSQLDYTTSAQMVPITYPSPYLSNPFGAGSIDPGCIIFWHGYISIEVNGVKLYKNWECLQHLYVPRGQATPTLGNANPVTGSNPFALVAGTTSVPWQPNYWNEYDGGNDAFYPLEPLPVFSGSKQSVVNLNLPGNIPSSIAPFNLTGVGYGTTFILKICLHLRGVLAQNSTSLH